jgi:hypothetical protein
MGLTGLLLIFIAAAGFRRQQMFWRSESWSTA